MGLRARVSSEHPEAVSVLENRDPCKGPKSSSSLCSPEKLPCSFNFSLKSPSPVLLTSPRDWKVTLAGSNTVSRPPRPGPGALTPWSHPRGLRPGARRDGWAHRRLLPSGEASGLSTCQGASSITPCHPQQALLLLSLSSLHPRCPGEFPSKFKDGIIFHLVPP